MLGQERPAGLAPEPPAGGVRLAFLGLGQGGVQPEKGGQVVGLGRRVEMQRPPEAGHPPRRLAAQHAVGAEVDRGVGRQLEAEQVGVFGRVGDGSERGGHRAGGGALAHDGQGPEQLGETDGLTAATACPSTPGRRPAGSAPGRA